MSRGLDVASFHVEVDEIFGCRYLGSNLRDQVPRGNCLIAKWNDLIVRFLGLLLTHSVFCSLRKRCQERT